MIEDILRAISGYCTFQCGNFVAWRSKKQGVVARLSIEDELRAMTQGEPMKLFCDDKSTISIAHNPFQHDRTKQHIE